MAPSGLRVHAFCGLARDWEIRFSLDDRPRSTVVADSGVFDGVDLVGGETARHDPGNGGTQQRSTAGINREGREANHLYSYFPKASLFTTYGILVMSPP